jgi:hypothetical protein
MKTITLNFAPSIKELKAAAPFSQKSFKANSPLNPKKAKNAAAFSQAKSQLFATSPFIFIASRNLKREIALFKQIMAMKNKFGEI